MMLSRGQPTTGIDEYARIIVQSRNAKMQKWRAPSRNPLSPPPSRAGARSPLQRAQTDTAGLTLADAQAGLGIAGPSSPPMRLLRRETTLGLLDPHGFMRARHASGSRGTSPAPSPLSSPVPDSDDVPEGGIAEGDGSREIEWVDWLDEYRRMKEAKLRSEQAEAADSPKLQSHEPSESAAASSDIDELDVPQRRSEDGLKRPARAGPSAVVGSTEAHSPSLSSSLGNDLGQLPRPRRPSEAPRYQRQRYEVARSSSSSHLGTGLEEYTPFASSSYAPPARRTSIFPDKPRNLSLSPITSRITSTGSQQSQASAAGRRRKNLGGKIEAWWGAVKSGFVGSQASLSSPRSSSGFEGQRSGSLRRPSPSVAAGFAAGTAAGFNSHARSHTNTQQSIAASSNSIHTLRAASSAQNLKQAPIPGKRMSGSTSRAASRSSSISGHADDGADAGGKRRAPRLSLNIDKGLSSFGAGAFDGLAGSSTRGSGPSASSSGPVSGQQVDSRRPSDRSFSDDVPTSPKDTRRLSDAWEQRRGSDTAPANDSAAKRPGESTLQHRAHGSQSERSDSGKGMGQGGGMQASSKETTINSIRQHIRHRLAASKESCDKELRRIVLAVNSFVEESMQARQEQQQAESGTDTEPEDSALFGVNADSLALGLSASMTTEPSSRAPQHAQISRDSSVHSMLASSASCAPQSERSDSFDPDQTPQGKSLRPRITDAALS